MRGLLRDNQPDNRITGTILSAVSPGWWIVQDQTGRKYRVAGSGLYRKNDRVSVIGGQIISAAGSNGDAEVHQV